jgi:hypothetical protein
VSAPERPSRRTLVESCAVVSARSLVGLQIPSWNPGEVDVTHDWGGGVTTSFRVSVVTSNQPCGGVRRWWACPRCSRRVGRLYSPAPGQDFACRRCHRLGYQSELYVPPAARAYLRLLRRMQRGFTPPEGPSA